MQKSFSVLAYHVDRYGLLRRCLAARGCLVCDRNSLACPRHAYSSQGYVAIALISTSMIKAICFADSVASMLWCGVFLVESIVDDGSQTTSWPSALHTSFFSRTNTRPVNLSAPSEIYFIECVPLLKSLLS